MVEKQAYSVTEVAQMLGMSGNGVYNAIAKGDLPSVKIGGKVLIPAKRLEALLNGTKESV